jgi:hypothetical protein
MRQSIKYNIDKEEFLKLIHKNTDIKSLDSFSQSDKTFYGVVDKDGFKIKLSNTYGTKPVVNARVKKGENFVVVDFTTETTPLLKVFLGFFIGFGALFGLLIILTGFPLGLIGVAIWFLFLILIWKFSYSSEFSAILTIIRNLVNETCR